MVIDMIVLVVIYMFYFFPKWLKKELICHTLIYLYLMIVFLLTLSPCLNSLTSIFSHQYTPMMMTPFRDFIKGYEYADWQVFLNILLFVPLGYLLPKIRYWNGKQVVLCSFMVSVFIEVIQPLLNYYRRSDITDVICNTLGGFIGYMIYKKVKEKGYRN